MENKMNRGRKYHYKTLHNRCMYVVANDAIRLDGLVQQVNNDIKIKKFEGLIVFDMLIINGNTKRRYFQSFVDNNGIDIGSLSSLELIPEEIIKVSNNYVKTHINVLEQGVLSQYEISKIKESLSF